MSIEVGNKLQGKVTGITNFGAFVELEGGKTGLVHISEVADNYVKDINDILTVGDEVTVKVMNIGDDGKIGLSIRKAVDRPDRQKLPQAICHRIGLGHVSRYTYVLVFRCHPFKKTFLQNTALTFFIKKCTVLMIQYGASTLQLILAY